MLNKKTTNPIIFENTFKINNNVIQIYIEKIKTDDSNTEHLEFIFTVNGSTHKSLNDFSLVELYKILKNIQSSIEQMVENVVKNLKTLDFIKLEFEADGKDISEISNKNNCYQYYIRQLATRCCKKYNIHCDYQNINNSHFLLFREK